ncbi:Fc.00g069420.m01.CDS01 [Cosmosporella sp. VM-42]
MSAPVSNGTHTGVRFIPLTYDNNDSQNSALKLILTLFPDWASEDSNVELIRFTDGITNTLLKVVNRRPGLSKQDIDRECVLLRAYGHGTAVLIDREREAENHELLMKHKLAPTLLARFQNGMLYRFISGTVAHAQDLSDPPILRAIARRLAQWHATVPCLPDGTYFPDGANGQNGQNGQNGTPKRPTNGHQRKFSNAAPEKASPNLWTVLQKWILAMPTETEAQLERQSLLQQELEVMIKQLSQRPGLGRDGLVFAHCDLLCANVIIHRDGLGDAEPTVSFIDYEYATPSPAAFDICNHFAEWAGYDCDYTAVPTVSQRQAFIQEYVKAYFALTGQEVDEEEETRKLVDEVDAFRGVPGFYWGIWASIQTVISKIDFDYAKYAELRLSEYWAYKGEAEGTREASAEEMPLREKTWWSTE